MVTKTFFILEDDLAVLEAELPRILEREGEICNDPMQRKRWEMVKTILSSVRWSYGPPLEVRRVENNESQ